MDLLMCEDHIFI